MEWKCWNSDFTKSYMVPLDSIVGLCYVEHHWIDPDDGYEFTHSIEVRTNEGHVYYKNNYCNTEYDFIDFARMMRELANYID